MGLLSGNRKNAGFLKTQALKVSDVEEGGGNGGVGQSCMACAPFVERLDNK